MIVKQGKEVKALHAGRAYMCWTLWAPSASDRRSLRLALGETFDLFGELFDLLGFFHE